MPISAKNNKNLFFTRPTSARAPRIGALMAIIRPTKEFIEPMAKVL